MKKQLLNSFLAGFVAIFLSLGLGQAQAADNAKIDEAMAKNDMGALRGLMTQGPSVVDDVVKALLRSVQDTMTSDPAGAQKKLALAADYAPQITPPTVPAVCADMRRIAEGVPTSMVGTPLHQSVMKASQSFANAPVVVAAGRPNLCEEAWLQVASLAGDDALFAQIPLGPRYNRYRDPNPPPHETPQKDKPSAD